MKPIQASAMTTIDRVKHGVNRATKKTAAAAAAVLHEVEHVLTDAAQNTRGATDAVAVGAKDATATVAATAARVANAVGDTMLDAGKNLKRSAR